MPRRPFDNRLPFIQKPNELDGALTELLDAEFDESLITGK
jgi:hypothetical protein